MSFLTPLFLLGGLALALPVIFHLIRRTTRERTVFSSLMFLQPTPPRLTKRSRLEHWLLLLLRCLALALLAMGFARPFFKQPSAPENPAGTQKRRVVLLDTSASMRRTGLWAEAQARALAAVKQAGPGDQLAIWTFARETRPLVSFGDWTATPQEARAALAGARLGEVAPGWAGTHLGPALIAAAEALADTEGQKTAGPREIVLISDLQAGSHTEAIQGYEWPKGVTVIVEALGARPGTNAGVQVLPELVDGDRQAAATVRVRVTNAPDAKREEFKIGWVRPGGSEFVGAPVETYVPPGQTRIVALPAATAAGAQAITLRGDDEDFDNTVFVVPPTAQPVAIAYLGTEAADDAQQPRYFLQRALPATPRLAIAVTAVKPEAALPADAAVYVVTEAVSAGRADELRAQALAGKTVLAAPKNAAAAATLAPLLGLSALPAEEGRPKGYAMLAEIDFKHPLFAPFADPRYSDFTKIHFWKYRRLDLTGLKDVRTLARFDQGDPALAEVPVGKGRVVLLAAGWNTEDSQLAVSSKFVPLLLSVLELGGALKPPGEQAVVNDVLPLGLAAGETATVARVGGVAVIVPAGTAGFAQTTQPGIYRITKGDRTETRAVNLDAAEARTAPMAADELERLGVPVARAQPPVAAAVAREVALQGAEAESRQKLWRWFVIATLLVLLGESLLAGRTARRGPSEPRPISP
jgi:hypothetical protein